MNEVDIEDIEIGLFVDALFQRHGYDFRNYAQASLKRRVLGLASLFDVASVADLIPRILRDDALLPRILSHLSVPVSEMFRDPAVFKALRETVVPMLRSYPRLNIWHAGCATGEEAYSLAILLEEEGLLQRALIYATDINDSALASAEEGIFSGKNLADHSSNYLKAGGKKALSDYVTAGYDFIKMNDSLKSNIVFAHHNLVSDGVFCEVNMLLCRNVMIYFDRILQNRVFSLFRDSLGRGGFLCLGNRESLQFADVGNQFVMVDRASRIYKKVGGLA